MRWQKIAQLAIALFVVGFAILVVVSMRPRPVPPANAADKAPIDPKATVESGAGVHNTFNFGKLDLNLKYERALTYSDGRSKFAGVTLTLPDRNGRTFIVTADEGELVAPPDKQSEMTGARLAGNVKMRTDNNLEVLASTATYNGQTGVLDVPGPVTFSRGRMKGSGVGATYDRNRDVLWLLAEARLTVAPDASGGGAVDASAAKAGLARADSYVQLEGSARVTSDARTAEADNIKALLDEPGEKIQQLQLRERSRITGTGAGAQLMTARNIDLTYAADGRTLQHSKLMEGAVVELPGPAGAPARRIAGTTIESSMTPDGATVSGLNATENVQVDLPATPEAPARRIRAASLRSSGGAQGLQNAIFEGSVDFVESRPATGKSPAVERHATSTRLVVDTKPGLGPLERADFRGNVRFDDGDVRAEAPRAVYGIAADQLDLSPSDGDGGPGPILNNPQLTVQARNIHLSPSTQKLKADTDVRSTVKTQKKGAGRGAANGKDQTRVPAMLKQDQPVFVTSNRLEYDGVAEATYNGNALLWQDKSKSRIAAETIVMNDRSGNLTARGDVRTTMMIEDEDAKTKARTLTETRATADTLVYDDAKRLATYTATGTTLAKLTNPEGDINGKVIDLYLREGGSELDRVVADTDVTVSLTNMYATGKHLVYTAATDTHVLTGDPVVSVQRDEKGSCKETRANTLTYQRSANTIGFVAMPGIAATETRPIPCPATLRH